MRSGGCAVRQTLSADAAAVMAQAVSAARRRGHAQVTPLHVASALLAGEGSGVLRAACLRSRPGGAARPLQCKALEMCLNVALNRLATAPVAGGAASFGFHHRAPPLPALSNALAAAFKRAQASQRRGGSSEQQAAAAGSSNKKVELEQLVISILDDPSVNRVLREAGFCSADVKDHVIAVEQPAAGAVSSSPDHNSSSNTATTTTGGAWPPPNPNPNPARSNDAEPFPVTIKATTTNKPDELAGGGRRERAAAWRAAGLHPGTVGPHGGGLALNLGADSELIMYGGTGMMVAAAPARSVPSWFRRCHGPVPVLSGCDLALSFSSPPPAADSSVVYGGFPHYDHHYNNLLVDPRQHLWPINHRHDIINGGPIMAEPHDHHQQWPASPNNPGCSSNSVSASSAGSGARPRRFAELTAENLKVLCGALEARVPRHHRGLSPGVASAVLRRRSGVAPRTAARPASSAATWLVFRGPDTGAKAAVARELARLVFGSCDDLTILGSTTGERAQSGTCSGTELGRKRRRSSSPVSYVMQSLHDAVRDNPHRVFLIDGSENDYYSEEEEAGILMNAIATGTVRGCNDDDVASLEDAIVVLSCDSPWWSRAPSPRRLKKAPGGVGDGDVAGKEDDHDGAENGAKRPRFSLDLNTCAVDGDELVEDEGGSSLHGRAEILDAVDGVFLFQC